MNFCNCPNCQTKDCPNATDWKPIETAPMDGSEILIASPDFGVVMARWICPSDFLHDREIERLGIANPDDNDWFFADFVSGGRLGEKPTHWMPIPNQP